MLPTTRSPVRERTRTPMRLAPLIATNRPSTPELMRSLGLVVRSGGDAEVDKGGERSVFEVKVDSSKPEGPGRFTFELGSSLFLYV